MIFHHVLQYFCKNLFKDTSEIDVTLLGDKLLGHYRVYHKLELRKIQANIFIKLLLDVIRRLNKKPRSSLSKISPT